MSMVTTTADYATRLGVLMTGGDGSYTVLVPIKRTSDTGAAETFCDLLNDANQVNEFKVTSADRLGGQLQGYGATAAFGPNPVAVDTWYWFAMRVAVATTGFAFHYMEEGAGSWSNGPTGTDGNGFANLVLNDLFLGRDLNSNEDFVGIIGPTKIWNTRVSTADLLTEVAYRNVQTNEANCVGCFKFGDSGAGGVVSGVDESGTGNLTIVSDAQYSADEPSDILGDDPAGATTTRALINGGLINNGLINGGLIR